MAEGSQIVPYVDVNHTEGAALACLRMVSREERLLNHPGVVFYQFGIDTRSGTVPGVAACLDFARRMARVAMAAEFLRWWSVAHELGHYVANLVGWPRPHNERAIDDLAARIWIRRRAVLRAVGTVGWDPAELARYFGEVPAAVVFQRVAHEACGYAIGRDGLGRRFAYGPPGRRVPTAPTAWERQHLRIALAGAREPFLLGTSRGGEVGPFEDSATGRRGAVILFPEEAEFLR